MKHLSTILLLTFVCLILPSVAFAESNEAKPMEAKITEVTVLPDRAEVIRTGEIDLVDGTNTILVKNFETSSDLGSLRAKVTGAGDPMLNAINIKTIPVPMADIEGYKKLLLAIQALRDDITSLDNEKKVLSYKVVLIKKLLENSRKVFSLKLSIGAADIDGIGKRIEFYAKQEADCLRKVSVLNNKIESVNRDLKFNLMSLRSSYGKQNKKETVVFIEIQSKGTTKVNIELKYFVYNCSWYPSYELHYDSAAKKINVEYSASVTQRTGRTWNDVDLTLSTTTPALQIAPDAHVPWAVSFDVPRPAESVVDRKQDVRGLVAALKVMEKSKARLEEMEMEDSLDEDMEDAKSWGATAMNTGGLAVSFKIPDLITMELGNSRKFLISTFPLDADVANYTVPRINNKVYIRAKAKNTSQFPMLPGRAKCFIDGAFTAQTVFGRVDLNGELKVPLGYENRVKVKRVTVKDVVDEKGKKYRHMYHYRIEVTNNSGKEMQATIKDLLPVSQHDDLKVGGIDFSIKPSDRSDEEILTWNLTLARGEKKIIEIEYYIEYPKELLPVYQ